MPTKKKVLQVVINDEDLERLKFVMIKERRRFISEMIALIIHDFLDHYEEEHGKLLETSCDA